MRQAACDESQRGGNSARAMAEELFKLRGDKKTFLKLMFLKTSKTIPSRKINVW
jgi:hypothetical protein